MRHLRARDWVWIGGLLGLWAVYLAAVVQGGIASGGAVIDLNLGSEGGSRGYPVVLGAALSGSPVPALPVGTRVLQVAGRDLAGCTPASAYVAISQASRASGSAPVLVEVAGEERQAAIPLVPASPPWWVSLPFANGLILSSLLLLLRAPHWHLASRHFTSCVIVALATVRLDSTTPAHFWGNVVSMTVFIPLAFAVVIRDGFEFFERPGSLAIWQRVLPWTFAGSIAAVELAFYFTPARGPALQATGSAILFAFAPTAIYAFCWNFRLADAIGRRQFKWVLLGFSLAIAAIAVQGTARFWAPAELVGPVRGVLMFSQLTGPLGIFIAIAAYDLLDIDRVLSATAAYGLLGVAFLGGAFAVIPKLAEAASPALGLEPATGQLLLSMALAALVVPAYHVLRPRLDDVFLADQQAVTRSMEALLEEISKCDGAESITRTAGERLGEIFQPESLVLYAREGEFFTPVFVDGRAVPSAFEADSPLAKVLDKQQGPLASGRWSGEQDAQLTPFDRAALETLGAALIGPTRRGATLVGFWCFGPKRSGDIYTPTDLALMRALGAKISEELSHLDDTRMIAEAQQMQASLRRYVPGAVAEQLEMGAELESGEREVSVLFVDIRGYVGLSERRQAEEVFSSLNRHTERVSGLVHRHGGAIVEFHGDGVMAVFGAPRPLENKAAAAVEAARDITRAMRSEDVLSVGIGVATGAAFVGNIQSTDRSIWSVIGNTTNLAARLQSLTRDLEASVCIDAATRAEAGPVAVGFGHRPDVAIRGRSDRHDVWLLPL